MSITTYQYTSIVDNWTAHLQYTSWQITGNRQVSEDIVQEAFLALWMQQSKQTPDNPVGWLIKVVTNLSARYVKRKHIELRIYEYFSNENKQLHTEVEEQLVMKEKQVRLRAVFDRLPAQQKIIWHLSKDKGLRRAEIAACLQLSPNTVKVHLQRATQFMKEHLTCLIILSFLFVCNNIFFSSSNTKEYLDELFRVKYLTIRYIPENLTNEELLNHESLIKNVAKALTIPLIIK